MDLLNRGCQSLFRLFVRINTCVVSLSVLAYLVCQPVTAALPTVEPPSSGSGGGIFNTVKGYLQDGIVIGGLVVAAIAFINVATAAIHTFSEVRSDRASWTKFGAIVVVGVVLLVAVIWLLGKSTAILF
ncbi:MULTISPECIES: TIGR03745 family integrating conjugative element membrane protein [Photorhabdus]|uniref:TIGR03745 family integrating conjugative element membrane protein n=1 Tax=Photorhabdus TaxID=29487 RepID=UPI00052B8BCB|nr:MULTISPECIES: TIGR03745 family integrating conjugative element membrane protein [Photorhabdus]KGM28641.1 membrane protein [Photorhabdus luminescens]